MFRIGISVTILVLISGCSATEEIADIIDPPQYYIVPVGEVPEEDVVFAESVLEAAFDVDYEILNAEGFPEKTYMPERGQYNGRAFLDVYEMGGSDKTVYLTSENITRPDKNFVFGIAYRPGTVALISSYAMKGIRSRLAKTLIHETGHNYGLEHCVNRKCVVSATDGNYDIDCQDIFFCEDCAAELGIDSEERERRMGELEGVVVED
jgi:archaemetzincin